MSVRPQKKDGEEYSHPSQASSESTIPRFGVPDRDSHLFFLSHSFGGSRAANAFNSQIAFQNIRMKSNPHLRISAIADQPHHQGTASFRSDRLPAKILRFL
jgi:hypothetical protein